MKSKTLLFAAAALAASTVLATARQAVTLVGNEKTDVSAVEAVLPDKAAYSQDDLDNAVKDLYATGVFSDVRVARAGTGIVVTVKEKPVVANLVFVGNRRFDAAKLEAVSGLNIGSPTEQHDIDAAAAHIRDAYAGTGRRSATVTPEIRLRDGGFYDIVFHVDEGDRTKTSDIWFEGNTSFSDDRLRSVISTKETGLLTKIFATDVVDDARLAADKASLESFYRGHGFADVVVSDPEVDFDDRGGNVKLGFRVSEGRRYAVSDVTFENTTGVPVSDAVVKSGTDGLRGRDYDPKAAQKAADGLSLALEQGGASAVNMGIRPEKTPDGRVNLRITADQGDRIYVERIEISGNDITRDYVIRREFDFSEGDLLNPRLLHEAERRLNRLGFFDSVRISLVKGAAPDRAIVKVDVVEHKTGQISVGGAFSNADGPMALVSLTESNLNGTGVGFSISAGQGTDTGNYDIALTQPYLFGDRLTGKAELFRRDYDNLDNAFRPYKDRQEGGMLTVSGPVGRDVDLAVYYSFVTSDISDVDGRYTPSEGAPRLLEEGNRATSSVGYTLSYANLDDEKNPSNGVKATFGQQAAGIGGDTRFLKTEASARVYRELSSRDEVVGSLSVRAGQIAGIGQNLAFTDQFRMGGDLVRGFAQGGIGPRDASTGFLLGGEYYAAATAETIYPLPVLSDRLGLKGSVFADMGSVWHADGGSLSAAGSHAVYDDASIRASVGTGIVWDSPIGLFKANFALPVVKQDGDKTQAFSISGGTRF